MRRATRDNADRKACENDPYNIAVNSHQFMLTLCYRHLISIPQFTYKYIHILPEKFYDYIPIITIYMKMFDFR